MLWSRLMHTGYNYVGQQTAKNKLLSKFAEWSCAKTNFWELCNFNALRYRFQFAGNTSSLAISQPDSRWILTEITWTQVEATFYVLITFNKLACQQVHPNINIRWPKNSQLFQVLISQPGSGCEAKWRQFFIKVVIISRLVSWCIVEIQNYIKQGLPCIWALSNICVVQLTL